MFLPTVWFLKQVVLLKCSEGTLYTAAVAARTSCSNYSSPKSFPMAEAALGHYSNPCARLHLQFCYFPQDCCPSAQQQKSRP